MDSLTEYRERLAAKRKREAEETAAIIESCRAELQARMEASRPKRGRPSKTVAEARIRLQELEAEDAA